MAVPNTNNFSFSDVKIELENNGEVNINSLSSAFNKAINSGFHPTYVGGKDRLSNFRAYNHNQTPGYLKIVAYFTANTNVVWAPIIGTLNWENADNDGQNNTNIMIQQGSGVHSGTEADTFSSGTFSIVYSDWYLPAINELSRVFAERTTINNTILANYNSTGLLPTSGYVWSSTPMGHDFTNSLAITASNGNVASKARGDRYRVRPVRIERVSNIDDYNIGHFEFGGVVYDKVAE